MQGFLATIITAFTPQVLFAMLGGFIGALISSDRKRYGWQLSLLFMVVAIFSSLAARIHLCSRFGSSLCPWARLVIVLSPVRACSTR